MLSEIEVRTAQGDILIMPLEDVTDGIVITDIEGLDPVKATIVSTSFADQDGSEYQTSSRENRNLLFHLNMEPMIGPVSEVRKRLYKYFMPKSPVSFTFRDDEGLEVDISGRVESCQAPPFTKEPKMDVSIICFNSDFVDMTPVETNGATVTDTSTIDIDYIGNVETGMKFELFVDRSITEFTWYHTAPDGVLRTMDFAAPMVAGNVLTIVTTPKQKSANLYVSGTPTSILYGVSPHASWHELQPGENIMRVYAEGAPIPYKITHFTRYGGL